MAIPAGILTIATELGDARTVRAVETATEDPPWLALIDALAARGRLVEIDWKEAPSDILDGLDQVGGAAARRALKTAHAEMDDDRPTYEALVWFASLLAPAKRALVYLDKQSDSYPLAIVPVARVAPLQKLARTARQKIVRVDGAELAALVAKRTRKAKRNGPRTLNPWQLLTVKHRAGNGVLWNLQHGLTIDEVREARPFMPASQHALCDAIFTLYDNAPDRIARTTKQPELALEALKYLNPHVDTQRFQRLACAAILAERLAIPLDGKRLHRLLIEACNVWNEGKRTDVLVAKLPTAARELLARAGDAYLERARGEGTERWWAAMRMVRTVGDATSLATFQTIYAKARAARKPRGRYDDAEWKLVEAAIRARLKRRK